MQESTSCGHLYCKLKLRYSRYIKWPAILALVLVASAIFAAWRFVEGQTELSAVKEVALSFAHELKQVQQAARDSKHVLWLRLSPGEYGKPSEWLAKDGPFVQSHGQLPSSVAGQGEIKFDPDGAPMAPSTFVFQKGSHEVKLAIDSRGEITFPANEQQ